MSDPMPRKDDYAALQARAEAAEAERDAAQERARMNSFAGEGYMFMELRAIAAEARIAELEAGLRCAYELGRDAGALIADGCSDHIGAPDYIASTIRALTPPADLAERVNGTPDRGKMIRPAPDQSMCGGYPTGEGE